MHIAMRMLLRTCKKSKEKIQLQAHKVMCKTCNSYEHQSKLIDALLGQWFAPNQTNGSMKMAKARKLNILEKLKKA
jgi:hypothetical protein